MNLDTKILIINFKKMPFNHTARINSFLFYLIISFLFSNQMFSQAPSIEWQKCLGGSLVESIHGFYPTSDGGFILSGASKSSDGDLTVNKGLSDAWIIKLDSQGAIEWQKTYGGSSLEQANSVVATNDGGYIFCGVTYSTDGDVIGGTGSKAGWVVKINSIGDIQWQNIIVNTEANSVIQASDGNYVVVGHSSSLFENVFITKYDTTGNVLWLHYYGGSQNDTAVCVINTNEGGYIMSCTTNSTDGDVSFNHGGRDVWVIKLDDLGLIEWEKTFGGSQNEASITIEKTSDNGYILSAQSSSNDGDVTLHYGANTTMDAWIVKLNLNGDIQWQKTFGGTNNEFSRNIKQVSYDNGYVALFYTYSSNHDVTNYMGSSDFWVIRLNETGELQWQRTLGGNYNDYPTSIFQTNDNGFIVAGDTGSLTGQISGNHGQSDAWIVKLAPDALNLEDFEYSKISISPNPAKDYIHLNANTEILKKVIYDNLGRVLYSSETPETQIDISFLGKGIFYIEIQDGHKKIHIQKLIKI